MAEILTLTAPIVPPSITTWRVTFLGLDWDAATISIRLRGPNGEVKTCGYQGSAATSMMVALNKANLSSNSLHKRVLTQLVSDGEIAGTISGSPD